VTLYSCSRILTCLWRAPTSKIIFSYYRLCGNSDILLYLVLVLKFECQKAITLGFEYKSRSRSTIIRSVHYKSTSLKGKEARECGDPGGTSDLCASFITRECSASLASTRIEGGRLNGEPELIAFRRELVEGLLYRPHRVCREGRGGKIVPEFKERFDILVYRVRADRRQKGAGSTGR